MRATIAEFEFNQEKFEALVLLIANHRKDDPQFGRTKVAKTLFYSDFDAYRDQDRPLTGATLESSSLEERALQPYRDGGQTNVPLTDEIRDYLAALGGYFVLRISGHPTPPVSVWLA